MNNMSDRLKGTLEQISAPNATLNDINVDFKDDDIIPSRGGELIPFEMKEVATSVPEVEDNTDIRDDYVTARNLTHTLIEMSGSAIQGALVVAIQTQHPKAFSVFNELATTMRGLSKDLLEMQKIYKEISADKAAKKEASERAKSAGTPGVVQNTFVNLSLADVLRMAKEEEMKTIVPEAETVEVIE